MDSSRTVRQAHLDQGRVACVICPSRPIAMPHAGVTRGLVVSMCMQMTQLGSHPISRIGLSQAFQGACLLSVTVGLTEAV